VAQHKFTPREASLERSLNSPAVVRHRSGKLVQKVSSERRAGLGWGKESGFPFMKRNLSALRVDPSGLARVYVDAHIAGPGGRTRSPSPGTFRLDAGKTIVRCSPEVSSPPCCEESGSLGSGFDARCPDQLNHKNKRQTHFICVAKEMAQGPILGNARTCRTPLARQTPKFVW